MSKRLLLADDSITIQKVIQITFAHEDYELTITDNGDAALAMAREIKPDLVMTDIYMPGKNGYELTAAIKQDPALQHVPVLLLAGSFEPFDEEKARSCKADAWIEKPFESQNLIDKVAELLSATQEAPEAAALAVEREPIADTMVTPADEAMLPAFDAPASAEPEMAGASDDPFGDISFEEEVPVTEPETVADADDWSDFAVAPVVEEPVTEAGFATFDGPVEDIAEDFSFDEEELLVSEELPPIEESPAAEDDLDVFDLDDDEIMPLDDDDILDAEDLEPVMPEQTLAAWSRTEIDAEDVFAESLEEPAALASDADSVASFDPLAFADETSSFADDEFIAAAIPVFVEPFAEAVSDEEPAPVTEGEAAPVVAQPEPAEVAAAIVGVEAQVSAMSETDVEKIIEKIVTQVVEKLAGSILERVAWDVVPDLAENMIREEIRKIKDAAA